MKTKRTRKRAETQATEGYKGTARFPYGHHGAFLLERCCKPFLSIVIEKKNCAGPLLKMARRI